MNSINSDNNFSMIKHYKKANKGGCVLSFDSALDKLQVCSAELLSSISRWLNYFVSIASFSALFFSAQAYAELELHISKTSSDGIPIYIANISGGASGIIEADLKRSGRFTIVPRSKIPNIAPLGGTLNAGAYQNITDFIVRGKQSPDGTLDVELVSTSDNAKSFYKISSNTNRRRVAHKAADKIYEKVTREKGAFDTRLAYVLVTNKANNNRTFKLYISDADGYNPQAILTSREPIMSPAWSPDGSELAYVSFEQKSSAIYAQNIFTGAKRLISAREGINGAPAWSPNGVYIAMSLSMNGNPDIYTVNTLDGRLKQITTSSAIDTEPAWSGTNSLLFTSNRGGNAQLYRVSAFGGKPQRVTFDAKYNSAADVASKKLAYITGNRGAFHVAIKSLSGSGRDMLSNGQLDESPSLSPNGAMVAYTTKRNGRNTLAVVSDNAKSRQFLTSPAGDIREPAWSPYVR